MPVNADEIRPALLDIKQQNTGLFAVTWKVPMRGDKVLKITPILPDNLELVGTPTQQNVPGALIEHATYKSNAGGLPGRMIEIEGLTEVQTDVLLLVQLQDGSQHSAILRPSAPRFEVPLEASKLKVAGDYWLLDVIRVPSAPTEAIIALSILFLAAEIVHKHNGQVGITERWPWLIAFLFGLFHGLGFAGALSEIGVPQTEVPLALFMFNVGVETGQLMFIAVVMGLLWLLQRLHLSAPPAAWRIMPYSIGGLAAYWTIDRVMSFMPFTS
jgi:hypothetical protein